MRLLRRLYCAIVGHDWDYDPENGTRLCWGCMMSQRWTRLFMYGGYMPGRWENR